ncbi:MAG: gamma-glutamyltransferase [Acidobacteria bacterium]|nr:MAG: gamma-glutamyltransferase [Acidobacteriota bacterium]RPJ85738.1 MAG: gamma-glutamyltransferase [Acidobacteriota bacterium]
MHKRTAAALVGLVSSLTLLAAFSVVRVAGQVAPAKGVEVVARNGMVASAHPLTSQAGLEILRAGGNAVDAAVAAAFAIGVAEPNANGLGGEGMLVVYIAKPKKAVAIDYRSAAPATAAYPKTVPATGHQAAAIPGTVAGLTAVLERYGTMKLPQVMAPAIKIAESGFVVSSTLAAAIADNFEEIVKNEPLAAIVCPTGLPLEAGATLKNPVLAATLRKIAAGGRDVFYKGEIAQAIAKEMAAKGGFITREDLAEYRAVEREPVRGTYRDCGIISAPPPVGGLAVIETLQILEHFEMGKMKPFSTGHVHVVAEALKRGFADWGAFVGDPGFVEVPLAGLLSRPYAKARAAEISLDRISAKVAAGEPAKYTSPSTTALSTVDSQGNMVALTQTISDFFGAKVAIEGTAIILNNEMKNFSARGVNEMAPGKRMRTTIAPTILLRDGRAFATLGTPGAARIISTMTLIISNLIDYKMGIQEAIEAPRFFARDGGGQEANALDIEERLPAETQAALSAMGYNIKRLGAFDLFFGGAQGIVVDPKAGRLIGGADPRRDGAVVGY